MQRVGGWLQGRGARGNSLSQALKAERELKEFQDAMKYAAMIMNDDVEGAEEGLKDGHSSFHKLERALVGFFKVTLGFERDLMKEASERLSEAESSASNDASQAQRSQDAYQSNVYTKGSEFALCAAEAQIMTAVMGILNESLTEAIKGFYKVRKAFITLEDLYNQEMKYLKRNPASDAKPTGGWSANESIGGETVIPAADSNSIRHSAESTDVHHAGDVQEKEEEVFADAKEDKLAPTPLEYQGHLYFDDEKRDLKTESSSAQTLLQTTAPQTTVSPPDPRFDPHSESPIDAFIQSGVNLFYGFLLLMISNIPPAFSKLLSIIGFHGDKQKGLLLLWKASQSETIHGAQAALCLLGWYNGLVGFCDIIPDPPADSTPSTQIEGYPIERLQSLISTMSSRYPNSQLWLLERARMYGSRRNLSMSLKLLQEPSVSNLKQITAIQMFERGMSAMYAHEYNLSATSFLTCADLNTWSKALYYYNAGACHLVLYRRLRHSDPEAASNHAKEADAHFHTAPTYVGRKRILARTLPLDIFVARKIEKWDQQSRSLNIAFVDVIGVSPTEEVCYLWNGYRKKTRMELEHSLEILSSTSTVPAAKTNLDDPKQQAKESEEEQSTEFIIRNLLTSAILRHLRRHDEALSILQSHILPHPRSKFHGDASEDWILPIAHYEAAANHWMQRSQYRAQYGDQLVEFPTNDEGEIQNQPNGRQTVEVDVVESEDRELVKQCKEHIMTVKNWPDSFTLESRVGMKVTSAVDAIGKWEKRYGEVVV